MLEVKFVFELDMCFVLYLDRSFDIVLIVVFERLFDGGMFLSEVGYCMKILLLIIVGIYVNII